MADFAAFQERQRDRVGKKHRRPRDFVIGARSVVDKSI
jgi:hypothetical protein